MAYRSMSKLITNENLKLAKGECTREDYDAFKILTMNKLDVFLTCNRLTSSQYEELVNLLQ